MAVSVLLVFGNITLLKFMVLMSLNCDCSESDGRYVVLYLGHGHLTCTLNIHGIEAAVETTTPEYIQRTEMCVNLSLMQANRWKNI